jgi:1,4-dihydroxy-6-naphthoate synthase
MGGKVAGCISFQKEITLAHSPDPDDAFIFYGLLSGRVDTGGLSFRAELSDIETLNQKALACTFDVTVLSLHGYSYVYRDYYLTSCGASIGRRYGPIVVSKKLLQATQLEGKRVAIPGRLTTATLLFMLYQPFARLKICPFDSICEAIQLDEVDAGILIHELQLSYADFGLRKLIDLGEWWWRETKMNLPLGFIAIKRSLGEKLSRKIADLIRLSIRFAFGNREESLNYAQKFARGLDRARVERFINMYISLATPEYEEEIKEPSELLLRKGLEAGLLKDIPPAIEFI